LIFKGIFVLGHLGGAQGDEIIDVVNRSLRKQKKLVQ